MSRRPTSARATITNKQTNKQNKVNSLNAAARHAIGKNVGKQLTFESTFLPRDASAERGNATVSRPSVRPSVCDV